MSSVLILSSESVPLKKALILDDVGEETGENVLWSLYSCLNMAHKLKIYTANSIHVLKT